MSFSLSEYTNIDVAPEPIQGAYSASPDLVAGFKGAVSREEGNGGEGREGLGEGEKGGERQNGKGMVKGGSWGNSALVVGGTDANGHVFFNSSLLPLTGDTMTKFNITEQLTGID